MKMRFRRPSPAMIVACLALFVASTGTSIAARHYLITSTKQIKPSVIKKLKGNRGPRGVAGAQGTTGATGAGGATHVVKRYAIGAPGADFSHAVAECNAGETVTGGGADYDSFTDPAIPVVRWNAPSPYGLDTTTPTGWEAVIDNRGSGGTVTAIAWVMCAQP
jgi:hypothetical protein